MMDGRTLEIAMIGSKGIPAVFGGIEKHVEEISVRLAARGHKVTVYGRAPFSGRGPWKGVRLKIAPSIRTKSLDTATNSMAASMSALFGRYDIVHYHGIGPSIFCNIPVRPGTRSVATIHALDYRQSKWGPVARRLLMTGERKAVTRTDAAIAVSRLMASGLAERYGREVHYIPNGASIADYPGDELLSGMGLEKERYILSVGRFIVERGFHTLIEAFRRVKTRMKLVIAGDARFEEEYAARLRGLADHRVVMPGYVTGARLEQLYANCALYVLPSLVEGLPISLIEAMSHMRPVLVSDIPENLEVARGIGITFSAGSAGDLESALSRMLAMSGPDMVEMGRKGREKVEREYDWDKVTGKIEQLYMSILA